MHQLVVFFSQFGSGFLLLVVLAASAASQDRSTDVRHCLSLADLDQRIECLETGNLPSASASTPTSTKQQRANPSFDCRTARNSIERAICGDQILSEWDSRTGQLFQQALKRGKDGQSLLEGQRLWLAERDNRCGALPDSVIVACLLESTKVRTAAITKTMAMNADAAVTATQPQLPPTSPVSQRSSPSETSTAPPSQRTQPTAQPDRQTKPPEQEESSTTGLLLAILGLAIVGISIRVFRKIRHRQRLAAEQQRLEDQRRAEWQRLVERYGEEIAARILARKVWQGMTDEQLVESWGSPADIGREIIRDKTKETWKYVQTGRNRFANRVYLENGIVIGWKT